MNVLSLFDGISCGREALCRAGITVDKYYSSEIDSSAIKIADKNYPSNIELGSVVNWRNWDIEWEEIDLLIGGSPCQGFSIAGKQLNFEDPRSKLFFEYADILNHIKTLNPNVKFLLENVRMKKEYLDIISSYLEVEPIRIDSALLSAQRRIRYYWTNIENIEIIEDKNILLKDICHEFMDDNFNFDSVKDYVVPFDTSLQILDKEVQQGKVGYFRTDSQANRVYHIHNKSVTLCGEAGGGAAKMGQYLFGCLTPTRVEKRQVGQRFNDGKKFYTLTAQDKHGVIVNGYIRKITPVECERLQTLPDNYTKADGVSETQRYKCLGNGWTVDIITHIFKFLNNTKGE